VAINLAGSGFSEGAEALVKQVDDTNWMLMKGFTYTGKDKDRPFTVPDGQTTDFASVPRVFIWFIPRYGRYTLPAILHDHLWRSEVPKNIDRIDADGLLRRAMRELGVPFLKRWVIWSAVRWGALTKSDGRKRWWSEAWRVIPVTLLVLPILLPPALLILIASLAMLLVEAILWVPLWLSAKFRGRGGRPVAKKVAPPSFSWHV